MFGMGGKTETVIGEGAEFKGQLNIQGVIFINGRVEGNINSDSLITLGEKGFVKGNLSAPHVVIGGEIEGDIFSSSRVELLGSARLSGDIRTPRVSIAEGAKFEGSCEMTEPESGLLEFKTSLKK